MSEHRFPVTADDLAAVFRTGVTDEHTIVRLAGAFRQNKQKYQRVIYKG